MLKVKDCKLENLVSKNRVVIDGSKALRKGINRVFSDSSAVQRCIHHKERNILSYLPQGRHTEFKRRWKRLLHGFTDYISSKVEYEALLSWLKRINYAAFTSLKEAEMETLTIIKLGVSLLLRKTLSSTNPRDILKQNKYFYFDFS